MASVTFPPAVGGDGSTVTDDANAVTGLANGGHRTRFVAAMAQVVAVAAQVVVNAAAALASKNSAATSETNAANSAAAAALALDQLDDRWLGAKASAPTLDNDGNALTVGASYWNTTSKKTFVWSGSEWVDQTFVPTAASGVSAAATGPLTGADVQAMLVQIGARLGFNWAIKTANYTMVYGDRIQANTTGGTFVLTLPATPTANQAPIHVQDYIGTFATNKLTVARNGSNINGRAEDLDITRNWVAPTFTYIDATIGWRIS